MLNKRIISIGFCLAALVIPQLLLKSQTSITFDAFAWAIAVVFAGTVLGIFASRNAHIDLLLAVIILLIVAVGVVETAAVMLWLVSSWCLGVLVLRSFGNLQAPLIGFTAPMVLGAAIWLAIWGVMLHFVINFGILHAALCLLPCAVLTSSASSINNNCYDRGIAALDWIRSIPLWAWILGLVVIGWVLRWASFPSLVSDDHAVHLRIWTELMARHRYEFDVDTQVWSVAPFAVALLHSGVSLIAGNDARSALNLILALALLLFLAQMLSSCKLPVSTQWLLVVLMASTPMLGILLLSLQSELVLAVLGLAGLHLVMDASGGWRGKNMLGLLAVASLCAAVKLPGIILGVTLFVALMFRWWNQRTDSSQHVQRLRWPALFVLVPLIFVALHAYILAWGVTGNPVFPLYNAIFKSPYFPLENFSDTRWIHGFSFRSYVKAFFHTSEFFESDNYTAGWQYLILLPVALMAFFRQGLPGNLRIVLIPILGFGLPMFYATQYWRYLFPVMPIVGIFLATIFFATKSRTYQYAAHTLAVVCVALNLFYFPKISWMMNSPPSAAFTQEGKKNLIRTYAPVASITNKINHLAPGSRVLYPSQISFGSTLVGEPLYINWYSPSRSARAASLKDIGAIGQFLSREKVDLIISSLADTRTSVEPEVLLREYLAQYSSVLAQEGQYLLHRIREKPVLYHDVVNLRKTVEQIENVGSVSQNSTQSILASGEPKIVATFQTHRADQARYKILFSCPSSDGFFVAQINWDKGSPYYRLVACQTKGASFMEALPIPLGASQGVVYITARDTFGVQIDQLSIGLN